MIFQKSKVAGLQKEVEKRYAELYKISLMLQRTSEYQVFETKYREVKAALIEEMLNCDEAEPIKYAFQMNSYVERIKSLGILIHEVDINIKNKPEVKKDENDKKDAA